MENVKVIIWGIGAMGSGMAKMLLEKKGVDIVGVCSRRSHVGENLFDVLEMDAAGRQPIIVTNDIDTLVKQKSADVVLVATDSFTRDTFDKIKKVAENGINVISIAEEMAFPKAQEPELAEKMDQIAKENGITILGTGINPGFVLDLLILALTGTCETVDYIKASRVNDLSPFGTAVMKGQGVGLTEDAFMSGVESGEVVGHVGFPESISMVAEGLGWKISKIEQTREPIISTVARETKYVSVDPGNVAGCRHCATGEVDGEIKIDMEHPQQIHPSLEGQDTGDYIWVRGVPNIDMQIKPEIPGGIGTIAMAVNMIPHVINSRPGLKTMMDMPVPRAIMGDMRDMIER
ncbi:2,4-diaminopentanoate dehydrogenase [Anoxynatronum buryatiense]|uniref:2,4-diaminopentanoate:NAD(P)+ oxidoreductase n=1 Tax=Anoxynatronum buryatiense TaxID=489973 RepID=A0AA45WUQ0_9CLOT|nr:2,4-diaminopentanoate dehydrogenase [Anoxynatronum buryatiense]SMP49251.1 2,4-diaminopentanoate:NAD(P)+ oxidoreductase [Anoxynatronum buryatiense]